MFNLQGKSTMIWRIRDWRDGDISSMVRNARNKGLTHVALKIADGTLERYEGSLANQNADYLPELVPALREYSIEPIGFAWTYGRTRYLPYSSIAEREATVHAAAVAKYGMSHFIINAELDYKRSGWLNMPAQAELYCSTLKAALPTGTSIGLTSYRFPTLHMDFPWSSFFPWLDFHMPQVYWEQSTADDAGSAQLARSFREFGELDPRMLPFYPVAPLYEVSGWQPTSVQIQGFLEKALELGLPAVSAWTFDRAQVMGLQHLLRTWGEFEWPEPVVIEPTAPIEDVVRALVEWARPLGYEGPGLE